MTDVFPAVRFLYPENVRLERADVRPQRGAPVIGAPVCAREKARRFLIDKNRVLDGEPFL
jgi:hypothetical protein